LNAYLDTSVLVAMLTVDSHTPRVRAWLPSAISRLTISDWGVTEFSSAVAIGVRTGRFMPADRVAAEAAMEAWLGHGQPVEAVRPEDIRAARRLIGATQLPLRASDALHLAIAQRLGAAVAVLDTQMRVAAADLGLSVETI
jgi:uncharacterized protein